MSKNVIVIGAGAAGLVGNIRKSGKQCNSYEKKRQNRQKNYDYRKDRCNVLACSMVSD